MTEKQQSQLKFFTPLVMLTSAIGVTAGDLLHYLIHVGPFYFSGGSFITPIFFFLLDIITEVYGYKSSRQVIWAYCICSMAHASIILIVLRLPSVLTYVHFLAFTWVFNVAMFAFILATIGIVVGMLVNAYYLTKWKFLLRGKRFGLRMIGSTAMGELVQLAFYSLGGIFLYHSIPIMAKMVVSVYLLRVCVALFLAVPGTIITNALKRTEGIDAFDNCVGVNPFHEDIGTS